MIRLDRMRRMDFLVKDLPRSIRREIWRRMDDINPVTAGYVAEKPDGYPGLRMMGYTDEMIAAYIGRSVPRFEAVNQIMIENNRYPVFADPMDTYRSACEYFDLIQMRPMEELEGEFGASFEDYVPKQMTEILK